MSRSVKKIRDLLINGIETTQGWQNKQNKTKTKLNTQFKISLSDFI